jgi:superfamily II DNA/RNA helicase
VAFLLPLLKVVDPSVRKVQAIILAPSRELVTQIGLVGEALFKDTDINVMSIIGGANVRNQIKRLRDTRPQILVATPGRLAELVFKLEKLRLGMVRAVIVDEIDNLLNEPFVGEIQTIIEATPLFNRISSRRPTEQSGTFGNLEEDDLDYFEDEDDDSNYEDDFVVDTLDEEGLDEMLDIDDVSEQVERIDGAGTSPAPTTAKGYLSRLVCLASATGNEPGVKAFADQFLAPGWQTVAVESASMLPSTITHGLISAPRIKALELLKKFLNAKPAVKSALIFVNDPYRVEIICQKLLEMGMIAAPLHGESSKEDRKVCN